AVPGLSAGALTLPRFARSPAFQPGLYHFRAVPGLSAGALQVGAPLSGTLLCLLFSPLLNLAVVAALQHLRHFHSFELGWPRVVRVLQQVLQAATEAVLVGALFVAQHARQQP